MGRGNTGMGRHGGLCYVRRGTVLRAAVGESWKALFANVWNFAGAEAGSFHVKLLGPLCWGLMGLLCGIFSSCLSCLDFNLFFQRFQDLIRSSSLLKHAVMRHSSLPIGHGCAERRSLADSPGSPNTLPSHKCNLHLLCTDLPPSPPHPRTLHLFGRNVRVPRLL